MGVAACTPEAPRAVTAPVTAPSSERPAAPGPERFEPAVREMTFAGLSARVLVTRPVRVGERVPMVVGLHGYGDSARGFASVFDGLPLKARVIVLDGPEPWGGGGEGRAWFAIGQAEQRPEVFDAAVRRVAAAMREARVRFETCGAPVVTGFSQGAMVSFGLAAEGASVVRGAVPVAGRLPSGVALLPGRGAGVTVVALHGTADPRIAYTDGAAAVARLLGAGYRASLVSFEGVGHSLPPAVLAALHTQLEALGRCP